MPYAPKIPTLAEAFELFWTVNGLDVQGPEAKESARLMYMAGAIQLDNLLQVINSAEWCCEAHMMLAAATLLNEVSSFKRENGADVPTEDASRPPTSSQVH